MNGAVICSEVRAEPLVVLRAVGGRHQPNLEAVEQRRRCADDVVRGA